MIWGTHAPYFVIENENVFEMDLMPDGAEGFKVTKAVWTRVPIRAVRFGMLMTALAWPFGSITPWYPEKIAGVRPVTDTVRRPSGLRLSLRVSMGIGPVPKEEPS